MECTKRGLTSVAVCSTAFAPLGRLQASALACPDLPISVVPHPFGLLTREDIRRIAAPCAADIARLLCDSAVANSMAAQAFASTGDSAALIEVPEDPHELNRFFHEQRWSDGLPVVAPTREYVDLMLRHTRRAPNEVVAKIAPAFGAATVERIAINAVLAGCYPEYLPVLLAAVEAMAAPELNLQTIQSTTNPAGLWLIVNGPVADRLGINSGPSCLGPGSWANATMGRALRLIQQNIGGALPGVMDRATHGYPGKYTFCCAENEKLTPWEPLHV